MLLQTLQANQFPVPALQPHQLRVRAPLNHNSPVHHEDTIRFLNRAQPVRHGDSRTAFGSFVESGLDDFFAFRVQGRGGFVEEQDLRVAEECAGDGDTLLLTPREESGFGSDWGCESVTGKC